MTLLYLIRHGETDFIGKRLAGWLPGIHLNSRGRAQAEALVELLSGVRFAALYASPLERARETAEPLGRALGLAVELRPGLGEVRPGRWQGQPLGSLRRRKLWSVVHNAPSLARFPEGESFVESQARVVEDLEELRAIHPKRTIACVSHADVIKLAIAHYLGLPLDMFHRLSVAPASVSVLSVADGYARLVRLNDTRATEQVSHD